MEGRQPSKAEFSIASEESALSGSLAVTDTRPAERLLQVLLTAFDEEAFEKVIEIADQAFTAWSTELSHGPELSLARAFLIKAMAYQQLDDSQTAIATYDELITRFGTSDTPEVQAPVAWALGSKGGIHREHGEFAEAMAAYEELITRFGTSEPLQFQVLVVWALSSKGEIHRERGEFAEAMAAYEELVTRFGTSEVPEVQMRVAWALYSKGRTHRECGEFAEAMAAYEGLVTRFWDQRGSRGPGTGGVGAGQQGRDPPRAWRVCGGDGGLRGTGHPLWDQ